MARRIMVPSAIVARFGRTVGEDDRGGGGRQPESTRAQNARGSQGCTKHELPRPIFCLVHRFVRLNYAQRPARFSCPGCPIRAGTSTGMAIRVAVVANQLHVNDYFRPAGKANSDGKRLGGRSFQKVKELLREIAGFDDNLNDLCVAQGFLTLLCGALCWRCQGAGTSRRSVKHQSGKGLHDGQG